MKKHFGNLPKMEVFGQSNIRDNMARKQPSVIPLWFSHFSLKYNIFYHYLLCEKRNRWRIITKFMDFFLKNAFRRMKKTPKIVSKISQKSEVFTLLKRFCSKICHESFLGRFSRAERCKNLAFWIRIIQMTSNLAWANTRTNFWDTP